MTPWNIQNDKSLYKSLLRYRADKAVFNNYRRVVQELIGSDNPSAMGIPKKGKHGGCMGTHITKSVVLLYRINYAAHRIDLLERGDHKMVYWRDS